MPRLSPLPEQLRDGPFTRPEARALGVSDQRLRSPDIVRLSRGLYMTAGQESGWPTGFDGPGHGLGLPTLLALVRRYPGAAVSHGTAAHVYRLPVPQDVLDDVRVHLTWPAGAARAQSRIVHSHCHPLPEQDRATFRRLPLTSPARTWLDLASDPRLDVTDLVTVSDAIVNRPWVDGLRVDGMDTLAGLAAVMDRSSRPRGIARAREALALSRVGADSPPETRTRLALITAGLPEPEVQMTAEPSDRSSPTADLGYRRWRIAIQYDGKHHRFTAAAGP